MSNEKKLSNPPPWTWVEADPENRDDESLPRIVDANGEVVCDFGDGAHYYPTEGTPPTGHAKALMVLAPSMEMMIRELEWTGYEGEMGYLPEQCPYCHSYKDKGHVAECEMAAMIAALEPWDQGESG